MAGVGFLGDAREPSVRLVVPFGVVQKFFPVSYWGMGYL